MRFIMTLVSVLLVSWPAAAEWREYVYPNDAFAIHFPVDPKIEAGVYRLSDDSTVPAQIYSSQLDETLFTVTIADLSHTALGERAVMDQAAKTLASEGEIKVNVPARVNAVTGRQFSIGGADGSHRSLALFYHRGRLYHIEGKALPAAASAGSSDAIRFQQSLRFTNNASRLFGLGTFFGALGRL